MPVSAPRTLPVVAALVAAVVWAVWTFLVRGDVETSPGRQAAGWALTVVGCVALLWRHRWPVPVAVLVLACAGVYFPLSGEDVPLLVLAFGVALYTVAAEGRLVAAVTIALVTLLAVAYGELGLSGRARHVDDSALFLLVGWFVGLVAAGYAHRTRQAYLHEAEQRALAAEREKDVRARQSAAEERLRIARELHDALGHSISLINVQANAALHRQAKDPSRTGELVEAMESVRDAGRDALRELRATLGVLRQVDEAAPRSPAMPAGREGLSPADVEGLAGGARRAGIDVRVEVDVRAELPPQVGTGAYRIVQESLTNVVRHARARTVRVRVWDEDAGEDGRESEGEPAVLRVRIEDDGQGAAPGATPGATDAGDGGDGGDAGDGGAGGRTSGGSGSAGDAGEGSGISGMAERARALGGTLTARNAYAPPGGAGAGAPGAATGFVVEARLPLRDFGEGM
ncbi:sensor histidine kinase [Streptomyces abyssalis]|uniref:sensor histidine kinase n=1 Tax=Streptomyces abyssalis TaxID=933944 RepID=UPI00085BBFCD|nr:histidine kinase [Streptomyces abyssalis]